MVFAGVNKTLLFPLSDHLESKPIAPSSTFYLASLCNSVRVPHFVTVCVCVCVTVIVSSPGYSHKTILRSLLDRSTAMPDAHQQTAIIMFFPPASKVQYEEQRASSTEAYLPNAQEKKSAAGAVQRMFCRFEY